MADQVSGHTACHRNQPLSYPSSQLRAVMGAVGKYQLGDPTSLQVSATALNMFAYFLYTAYYSMVSALFRPEQVQGLSSVEGARLVAKVVAEIRHFNFAVLSLVQLCEEHAHYSGSGVATSDPHLDFVKDWKVRT